MHTMHRYIYFIVFSEPSNVRNNNNLSKFTAPHSLTLHAALMNTSAPHLQTHKPPPLFDTTTRGTP